MSSEPRILRFSAPRDEPLLSRQAKRAQGVYYTPPEIVRWMVKQSLTLIRGRESLASENSPFENASLAKDSRPPNIALPRGLRILDPSCGAGAFLREAFEQIPNGILHGIDTDPAAVAAANAPFAPNLNLPPFHLDCCDFLSGSFSPAPFDLILGNPPYINIRELSKSTSAEYREGLRQRFQSARGNFDLYVVFMERSLQLLCPGGVCGMIVPNKWSGLDYARPLRELLLAETTLHDLVDLSDVSVFAEAEVYPHIVIFQKKLAAEGHAVRVREIASAAELQNDQPYRLMPQALLSPRTISLRRTLDIESRVPTEPLVQRAKLHSGASGYVASRLAELLEEAGDGESLERNLHPFIVSGNIDRYAIRLGNVRYMQRKFRQPMLDVNSDSLSPLKKKLYANPKIVIAGMSQRIEAAYDTQGLALGVQVYAAVEPLDNPYFLLALLNSRLMSFLFRQRFAAKKLAGGYLAMNKGQLEQLPIRVAQEGEEEIVARLAELASWGRLPACPKNLSGQAGSLPHDVEHEIDELVYQLYRLSAAEIRLVEAAFDEQRAKAA